MTERDTLSKQLNELRRDHEKTCLSYEMDVEELENSLSSYQEAYLGYFSLICCPALHSTRDHLGNH